MKNFFSFIKDILDLFFLNKETDRERLKIGGSILKITLPLFGSFCFIFFVLSIVYPPECSSKGQQFYFENMEFRSLVKERKEFVKRIY